MHLIKQAVPERATQLIRKFTDDYDSWLIHSLSHLPDNLRTLKVIRKYYIILYYIILYIYIYI